jgi:hypothetical protein
MLLCKYEERKNDQENNNTKAGDFLPAFICAACVEQSRSITHFIVWQFNERF